MGRQWLERCERREALWPSICCKEQEGRERERREKGGGSTLARLMDGAGEEEGKE